MGKRCIEFLPSYTTTVVRPPTPEFPCTNTHTHTEEPKSQVLRSHTHTHTAKGEAGRGDAGEWPKYDKERRGRGGIEPHLERQTTASPKSQVETR